jgi:hypothetical protein
VQTPAWLTRLERSLAEDEGTETLALSLILLASVAGTDVAIADAERRAAARRALLLLAAGGDPGRGLDLNGRAVTALADDLRSADRQLVLEEGMRDLRQLATGLPHVSEAVNGLVAAPDVAWRAYAASLLAEELAGDDTEEEG